MSQRAWIRPSVKKLIADEAIRNPKEGRGSLYVRLKRDIGEMGEVAPSEETTYKLISQARRNSPKFEELWTMASLRDNPLPPESIPSVSKVWRYAINTDEKFTLAQAEWAARLYTLVPEIPLLWFWSYQYAHEERLSLAVNEEMDSFIMDSNVILTKWERDTLLMSGFRDKLLRFRAERFLPIDKHGNIIEEMLHGIDQINPREDTYNERDHSLSFLIEELPALNTLGYSDEAKMVYLRWLAYLIKGPKWKTLSPEEALNIIVQLRQLVRHEQDDRAGLFPRVETPVFNDKGEWGEFPESTGKELDRICNDGFSSRAFDSGIDDLLRQVGYN
jgi:hypothetical protein